MIGSGTGKMGTRRMRYCAQCGCELGMFDDRHYERTDTCGKAECERNARDEELARREEAHDELDKLNGWD